MVSILDRAGGLRTVGATREKELGFRPAGRAGAEIDRRYKRSPQSSTHRGHRRGGVYEAYGVLRERGGEAYDRPGVRRRARAVVSSRARARRPGAQADAIAGSRGALIESSRGWSADASALTTSYSVPLGAAWAHVSAYGWPTPRCPSRAAAFAP